MTEVAVGGAMIGTDVGGTHTDVAVLHGDRVARGKALTTYDDFSRGLLEALDVAAAELDLPLKELLNLTESFMNSTTVVTNMITELRGSTVGVLTTGGFVDTLRLAGGVRGWEPDDHAASQVNAPKLVSRKAVVPITERIDWSGKVIVPLNEQEVEEAAEYLVKEVGVDAVAICFLSSFANPVHERSAEEIVRSLYPDLFVESSSRLFPVAGETRRFTTAVLNSFVQERTAMYLHTVKRALRQAGLRCEVSFFQGLGGVYSLNRALAFPLGLLGSGPAAGAIGANALAQAMGYKNVLVGDMGGTSFDTGIIVDNQVRVERNLQLGKFRTGINIVDVASVGAGGGSIVSVSELGVPRVGPHSAGSTPGPAAYGKGGEDPTVTDALVVLGLIDPERYLGGRIKLRSDLAESALSTRLANHFNWTAAQAASAIYELAVVQMATAVREVSVQKGHDPREFLFLAYGGTIGLFASDIASQLGVGKVVIPGNNSVFCAQGLLSADVVVQFDQSVGWNLSNAADLPRVNTIAEETVAKALAAMTADGFSEGVEIRRSAECRFQGQTFGLAVDLPARPLKEDDAASITRAFRQEYERVYGAGTAWEGVSTTMVTYSVVATVRRDSPSVYRAVTTKNPPTTARSATSRPVNIPGSDHVSDVPVYTSSALSVGSMIEGPAIFDLTDTTIWVPPNVTANRDSYNNTVLTRRLDG